MSLNVGQKEASPPAEVNPYAAEYIRLAPQTGQKPAEVRQEVLAIAAGRKVTEVTALGLWKSQNKNRLGGKVDSFVGRLLAVDGPRIAPNRDGSGESPVTNLIWALRNGKDLELRSLALWGEDRVKLSEGVAVDGLYSFKGAIKPGNDGAVSLVDPPFAPSSEKFPATAEIAQAEPEPLAKAMARGAKGRVTCLTQGVTGRVFNTQRGGGLEISDIGVDVPVTVFLAEPINGVVEGTSVKVLGQLSVKQGVATINGFRIWSV